MDWYALPMLATVDAGRSRDDLDYDFGVRRDDEARQESTEGVVIGHGFSVP